jgi:anthraniloyl-CoA monooxygenase
MWLGSSKVFDAFTFDVRETPYGVMQMHGYPYDAKGSTFIVEMHDGVWERAGFRTLDDRLAATPGGVRPGMSDERSIERVREIFADVLDGHEVMANNSRWIGFTTVRNDCWRSGSIVLLGDAAHTAHFSIGSGTKLAMEDALALAACLHERPIEVRVGQQPSGLVEALDAYELERRPVVLSTQRAAQASLEWFENLGQYLDQEPMQFAFNIMTRSRRVTYDNLRVRDHEFVDAADAWFAGSVERAGHGPADVRPPMFQPFRLRELTLVNRVVVSAMDMYCSVDGVAGDFHFAHLGG